MKIDGHAFWGTVANANLQDSIIARRRLNHQHIAAIEYRADLMPLENLAELLAAEPWTLPIFVADYRTRDPVRVMDMFSLVCNSNITGLLFHIDFPGAHDVIALAKERGKQFVAAYHIQSAVSHNELLRQIGRQIELESLFVKIAMRADRSSEALCMVKATSEARLQCKKPIASAVLGRERWARFVLPKFGSCITFVVADSIKNECGGDDEQIDLDEIPEVISA